jgi:hypothetical protein
MSVRVVARIRPLLKAEIEKDVITEAAGDSAECKTIVKIPNPKNESEAFSFQFNSVYDREATQSQLFDNEGRLSIITSNGQPTEHMQCLRLSNIFSRASTSHCSHMG